MKIVHSLLLMLVFPSVALARDVPKTASSAQGQPGFRQEFLANLDDVQGKILQLAEATPADKFAWRPAPGVRSMSEVYMHIAGGNYFLCSFLGVDAPKSEGDLEKNVTKKADVIAELKKSFDHLRSVTASTNDLEKAVKMFGTPTTHRGVLVTTLSHLHEHLGQAIAYARINGIVPPWSS